MNSKQYEEFCRFFLADQVKIGIDKILSADVPCAHLPDRPEYKAQIDHYWITGDNVSEYFNIANAKWRGSDKVDQGEMQLLQQVRQDVHAHKAVMITNTDFTKGARAVAENHGIALHIVIPEFDYSGLHASDGSMIQSQLQQIASGQSGPLYANQIVHRAFDLAGVETATVQTRVDPPVAGGGHSAPVANRMVSGYSTRTVSPGGQGQSRGGQQGGSGGSTRQGGGTGFRTK